MLFKKVILATIVISIIVLLIKFRDTPIRIVPLPYTVQLDIKSATIAGDILIIGDQLAVELASFATSLSKESSKKLSKPLQVSSIAATGEPLHLTIEKIKNIPKLPKLVFYLGSSEEYSKARFNQSATQWILENFDRFKDDKIKTLLYLLPFTSKFIFHNEEQITISEKSKAINSPTDARITQKIMEVTFTLFQEELKILSDEVSKRGGKLIFLTAPVNLQMPPIKTCENTRSETLDKVLDEIQNQINLGETKPALIELNKLIPYTQGNSRFYYLNGLSYLGLGDYAKAKEQFYIASAYDCGLHRSNAVFNNIIRMNAKKMNTTLLDFDELVNAHLGHNILFFTPWRPQDLFYGMIGIEMVHLIKKEFSI